MVPGDKAGFSQLITGQTVPSSEEEVPRTGSALNEQGENVATWTSSAGDLLPALDFKDTHLSNLPLSGPQPHRPHLAGFSATGKSRASSTFWKFSLTCRYQRSTHK